MNLIMMDSRKGKRVEYSTFYSWNQTDLIGFEKLEEKGKNYVIKIWCKLCAKHKSSINMELKGSAKTSALAFIDGTNCVTKHQVREFTFIYYTVKALK